MWEGEPSLPPTFEGIKHWLEDEANWLPCTDKHAFLKDTGCLDTRALGDTRDSLSPLEWLTRLSKYDEATSGITAGTSATDAISFVPPEGIGPFGATLKWMIDLFPAILMSENQKLSSAIALSLGDSFQASELPISPVEVLTQLIGLAQNPEMDPRCYETHFTAINQLVRWHGKVLVSADRWVTAVLIEVIIGCAMKLNTGEVYENDENSAEITSAAEVAAKGLKDPNLSRVVKSIPAPYDPSMLLAYVLVVFNVLDAILEDVVENMQWVANFVIRHLRSPSLPVREIAQQITSDLSSLLPEDQVDLVMALMVELPPFLDGRELTEVALTSLIALLKDVSIAE
jgi:hypothetical protein